MTKTRYCGNGIGRFEDFENGKRGFGNAGKGSETTLTTISDHRRDDHEHDHGVLTLRGCLRHQAHAAKCKIDTL